MDPEHFSPPKYENVTFPDLLNINTKDYLGANIRKNNDGKYENLCYCQTAGAGFTESGGGGRVGKVYKHKRLNLPQGVITFIPHNGC